MPQQDPTKRPSTADFLRVLTAASAATAAVAPSGRHVNVAVEGCCHGELNRIYEACGEWERQNNREIDFLVCCGDFQATRNEEDLRWMAVPDKYKTLGDFPEYFDGRRKAPILTIFIGGNHEASNVLWEQYYGGFVAPNIYYMGHSGVLNVCGLRIAALSGIFKQGDFTAPYPIPPYSPPEVRQAYHVRRFEIEKLRQLAGGAPIDIFLSHDWPVGITDYGDVDALLRVKPYFEEDVKRRVLGNPHTMDLLRVLQPKHWFAAHLHVRFDATVPHLATNTETCFVALDKCGRNHQFFDVLSMRSSQATRAVTVTQDPQWLRIIRATHGELCRAARGNFDGSSVARLVQTQPAAEEETAGIAVSTTPALLESLGLPKMPSKLVANRFPPSVASAAAPPAAPRATAPPPPIPSGSIGTNPSTTMIRIGGALVAPCAFPQESGAGSAAAALKGAEAGGTTTTEPVVTATSVDCGWFEEV